MSNVKKALNQMSDNELLQIQVKQLSRIRENTDKIFILFAVLVVLTTLGGIVMATS